MKGIITSLVIASLICNCTLSLDKETHKKQYGKKVLVMESYNNL